MAVDLSVKTIRQLFIKQVKDLTLDKQIDSIDMQFSDRLVQT